MNAMSIENSTRIDPINIFTNAPKKKFFDSYAKESSMILFEIGMNPGLKGFRYIKTAIEMGLKDSQCIELVTKTLYPQIARAHYTTSNRVERDIRTAIRSLDYNNPTLKTILGAREECTSKHFISAIVSYINFRNAS